MRKKSRKNKTVIRYQANDYGTAEQHAHGIYVEEGDGRAKHARHVTESPIDFYLHRKYINKIQWEAANMLFEGAVLGGMTAGIRSTLAAAGMIGNGENGVDALVASQLDARKKVIAAIASIRAARCRKLVILVCIDGYFMGNLEEKKYHKSPSLTLLRVGLERLAKFYRLI